MKILESSTISNFEYITLLASLKPIFEPKVFSCERCILEHGTSERLQSKTMRKRKVRGCFDLTSKKYKVENIKFSTCPTNFAIPIIFLIDSFHKFESNMLPFKGTLGEQPNKIIEIFDIIRHQVNEYQKRQKANDK